MRTRRLRLVKAVMTLLILAIALGTTPVAAQFGRIGDAARRTQEELRKKREAQEQAKKDAEAKEAQSKKEEPAAAAPASAPAQPAAPAAQSATADAAPSFQVYSKFDFVPGEKIVAFEDFTQDAIGDFPARWNTNGSGEVVTIAGKPGRWLKLAGTGFFVPEFITALPDDFTLEFDILTAPTFASGYYLNAAIAEMPPGSNPAAWSTANNVFLLNSIPGTGDVGTSQTIVRQDSNSTTPNQKSVKQFTKTANPVHVSMWRQRQRVRVYLNEEKVWDLPRALAASAKLNTVLFALRNDEPNGDYFIGNLRLAVGAPDTRNKLLTEGKWVTHGILFDVNSDRVRPESYGALKEIVNVLTENADVKIQIVGHTDADGDDARNLDLSKRRAASVKGVLAKEFAIADDRMDTDGKGETQPVDKNDTPGGKANNRRVEFIKK